MFVDYAINKSQLSPNNEKVSSELTPTQKKAEKVFLAIQDSIATVANFIISSLSLINSFFLPNPYSGKVITRTYNGGRLNGSVAYAQLIHTPYQVSPDIQQHLASKGCQLSPNSYRLRPVPVDGGKCSGATDLFLKRCLREESIDDFATGVPLEGVYNQEMTREIYREMLTVDTTLPYTWLRQLCEEESSQDNETEDVAEGLNDFFEINAPGNKWAARIHASYLCYLVEEPDIFFPQTNDPIDRVNSDINNSIGEELNSSERANLYKLDSIYQCGTAALQQRLALNASGLDLDACSNLICADTPEKILDRVEDLPEGAYKLIFDCTNSLGNSNVGHAVGFYVREDGSTLFYDSNYCIVEVSKEERQKTIEAAFKDYSGYSRDGITTFERFVNFILARPSPPADKDSYRCELFKVIVKSARRLR